MEHPDLSLFNIFCVFVCVNYHFCVITIARQIKEHCFKLSALLAFFVIFACLLKMNVFSGLDCSTDKIYTVLFTVILA